MEQLVNCRVPACCFYLYSNSTHKKSTLMCLDCLVGVAKNKHYILQQFDKKEPQFCQHFTKSYQVSLTLVLLEI